MKKYTWDDCDWESLKCDQCGSFVDLWTNKKKELICRDCLDVNSRESGDEEA